MRQSAYFLLLFLFPIILYSQEHSLFSLSDQNLVYSNPAFTGTANNFRAGNSFRNILANISGNQISNTVYADQYFGKFGAGGIAYSHSNYIRYSINTLSLSYAYRIKIGDTSHLQFGLAPSFSANEASYSYFNNFFNNGSPPVVYKSFGENFNFSGGVLFYNHLFFAGYALHNINQPSVPSYLSHENEYNLPLRHSVQFGLYWKVNDAIKINLFGNCHFQKDFQSISQVIQVKVKHLLAGFGYQTNNNFLSRFGIVYNHFRLVYGYDIIMSNLSILGSGSHEINLQVLLDFNKKSNPYAITY